MACNHCTMMDEYYAIRYAQETRVEDYSKAYATEEKEFYSTVEPRFTFKAFLEGRRYNG